MASGLIPGCHVMSDLLTIREKNIILTLVEPQCKLIKTTVAQVLEASETAGVSPGWRRLGCGVVCLVEDESNQSHFLRLYCVKCAKLLWEQELYIPFEYTAPRTFFHTFPADHQRIGFNFANETEAEEFYHVVKAVQKQRPEMITNMIKMVDTEVADSPDSGVKPVEPSNTEDHFPVVKPCSRVTSTNNAKFKDLDPAMTRLLKQAELPLEELKDRDIAEVVDCIINKFGGITAVQKVLRHKDSVSETLTKPEGCHHLPAEETEPTSDSSSKFSRSRVDQKECKF